MNVHYRLFVIIAAIAIASPAKASGPLKVFGIPLGQPFTVHHCKDPNPIISVKEDVCWTYEFPGDPLLRDSRTLYFREDPDIGYAFTAVVKNNITTSVLIETVGIKAQDSTMSQLREKFGKPTAFDKVPMQNMFGAQFIAYHAQWLTSEYYVQFKSVDDDGKIDHGWIEIDIRAEYDRFMKARQSDKSRPKL